METIYFHGKNKIRPAAVAGYFYPGSKEDLDVMVEGMYYTAAQKAKNAPAQASPKALVVPHAGYVYSGVVAAQGYRLLEADSKQIKRVILIGPCHRGGFSGVALHSASHFETPLGLVAVDTAEVERVCKKFSIMPLNEAHALEHSLEVQLPFLQKLLIDFSIVPILVGDVSSNYVAEIIEECWDDKSTVFVISSDLSHYLPYDEAVEKDLETTKAILEYNVHQFGYNSACGGPALTGFLLAANKHHLQSHLVACCNSGDTAGDKSQVVGYGAYSFSTE